jgi:hypothetical protein
MNGRTLRVCVFAAALVLAVAGLGGAAIAKKKHHKKHHTHAPGTVLTVSNSGVLPAFAGPIASTRIKATCPDGTQVLSGGYDLGTPPTTFGPSVFVMQSGRTGAASWGVSAVNITPNEVPVTVQALCRANIDRLAEVNETATLAPGAISAPVSTTVVATCPAGMQAISGTTASNGSFAGTARSAMTRTPAGDGWSATFSNEFPAIEATVIAYCGEGDVFTVRSTANRPSDPSTQSATYPATAGPCPSIQVRKSKSKKHRGKNGSKAAIAKKHKKHKKHKTKTVQTQLVGGGFSTTAVVPLGSSGPLFDELATPGGWRVRATQVGPGDSSLTSEAYCMA